MLGRSERESAVHALMAAERGGWTQGDSVLLDLGARSTTLSTIAALDAISAVVHIGHPAQPLPDLERLLLAADNSLVITSASSIESQWTLVSRSQESSTHAIIDESGMRDCRYVLRTLGIAPHVVPTSMSVEERAELAGEHGMLVIERSVIPAGFIELPDSYKFAEVPALWYGLVQKKTELPSFTEEAQVWLAFGPHEDHQGSLLATLSVFAEQGIDLQHLRSQRSAQGPHIFLSSFGVTRAQQLNALLGELTQREVQHRVLAVLQGSHFVPGPDALTPVWSRISGSEI
ncbi:hypothetical protein [Timonella sp. A28]|uniref:hypothetical protein n=1 Tax=Timonella sp. A28 TaxID=3442640 RepID=UPI003EBC05FE